MKARASGAPRRSAIDASAANYLRRSSLAELLGNEDVMRAFVQRLRNEELEATLRALASTARQAEHGPTSRAKVIRFPSPAGSHKPSVPTQNEATALANASPASLEEVAVENRSTAPAVVSAPAKPILKELPAPKHTQAAETPAPNDRDPTEGAVIAFPQRKRSIVPLLLAAVMGLGIGIGGTPLTLWYLDDDSGSQKPNPAALHIRLPSKPEQR